MKYNSKVSCSLHRSKKRTQIPTAALVILIGAAMIIGFTGAPSLIAVAAQTVPSNTTTETANTASSISANTTATAKPVDGYNTPQGHVSAIRHLFDDAALRVQHYCKPNDKVVLVCQLYDSDSKNATLIGVEYIITYVCYSCYNLKIGLCS